MILYRREVSNDLPVPPNLDSFNDRLRDEQSVLFTPIPKSKLRISMLQQQPGNLHFFVFACEHYGPKAAIESNRLHLLTTGRLP
jgi:hypothetical protein